MLIVPSQMNMIDYFPNGTKNLILHGSQYRLDERSAQPTIVPFEKTNMQYLFCKDAILTLHTSCFKNLRLAADVSTFMVSLTLYNSHKVCPFCRPRNYYDAAAAAGRWNLVHSCKTIDGGGFSLVCSPFPNRGHIFICSSELFRITKNKYFYH